MELVSYIIVFLLGFFLGIMYLGLRVRNLLNECIDEIAKEDSAGTVYKLKTELMNDTLFLYDNANNFVCQGSTIEELAKLSKEIKNINYAAVLHGDKIVVFTNGEVVENV